MGLSSCGSETHVGALDQLKLVINIKEKKIPTKQNLSQRTKSPTNKTTKNPQHNTIKQNKQNPLHTPKKPHKNKTKNINKRHIITCTCYSENATLLELWLTGMPGRGLPQQKKIS